MAAFLLATVLDVTGVPLSGAALRVGFDGASPTPAPSTAADGTARVSIPDGTTSIAIAVTKSGWWDCEQELAYGDGAPPDVSWRGAQALNASAVQVVPRGDDFDVTVTFALGHLRDAGAQVDAVLAGGGISYLSPQGHVIRDLDATAVLDPAGTGWDQLAHTLTAPDVPAGKVFFVERTAAPKLVAVYVPPGLIPDPAADGSAATPPIPFHLFFHPSDAGWPEAYPFSTRYLDLVARYCFYPQIHSVGKAMVNQHAHADDACAFVFPVGSPKEAFGDLATQASLHRLFQELSFFVQRMQGIASPTAAVGRCAVSGFSYGGESLLKVMMNPDPAFDALLREVYGFDPVIAEMGVMVSKLGAWLKKGDGRSVRVYTQDATVLKLLQGVLTDAVKTTGPANAEELESPLGSVVYVPFSTFWSTLGAAIPVEGDATLSIDLPPRTWDTTHQLIPALFMQHARKKGRLAGG